MIGTRSGPAFSITFEQGTRPFQKPPYSDDVRQLAEQCLLHGNPFAFVMMISSPSGRRFLLLPNEPLELFPFRRAKAGQDQFVMPKVSRQSAKWIASY